MSKPTQTERLLDMLRLAGGLCAMEPLRWSPPITRVAARVYDLRQQGHRIESKPKCPQHAIAGQHAYYEYRGSVAL